MRTPQTSQPRPRTHRPPPIYVLLKPPFFFCPRFDLRRRRDFVPPPPCAEAQRLRRSATLRCPITSRALRRHRHTAPGFGNRHTQDSGGSAETSAQRSFIRLSGFQSEDLLSRGHLFFHFLLLSSHHPLTGQHTQRLPLLDAQLPLITR